jgi:acetylornithine deacetylase/succinyl-diaminopimelate desuccinylase-like protein
MSAGPATNIAAQDAATQVRELLPSLIRFNTVNPPGNERAAQEHLAGLLGAAGFECELIGAVEERPNLIARLRAPGGGDGGPTLCYLGHLDTVLADPSEWTHDPWSGESADGFIWGRGALDMKSQVAAEASAGAALARSGWRPSTGELLLVFVVDEETGGSLGAQWLTQTHPEKVRCDFLINEGGGPVFEYAGRRGYGVCCAEKGVFRFTISTAGVAGHASMPRMGDNALLKMAPLLQRLGERQPSYTLTDESRALLATLGEDPADPAAAVASMREEDPLLAIFFEPMLGVTFAPTRISASEKVNVIPSRAELKIDCRTPPGLGEEEVRAGIAEVLGDGAYEIEFSERVVGNRSPTSSRLMDEISAWIDAHDPGAETVPVMLPGFTDSRHFRAAFPDCVAYGFFPHRHQSLLACAPLVHAPDERIDVRDLAFATQFLTDLAVGLLD